MNGCSDCDYAKLERAGMLMGEGVALADADALAAGERCAKCEPQRRGDAEGQLKMDCSAPQRLGGELRIVVLKYDPHRKQDGEYIGYPRTLAGEFRFGFDGTREEVVGKYRAWLFAEVKAKGRAFRKLEELLGEARTGAGLVLVCLEPEFGEVIRRCLEWMNQEETHERTH